MIVFNFFSIFCSWVSFIIISEEFGHQKLNYRFNGNNYFINKFI